MAEWLKAADCKSAGQTTYGGSNPPLSTRLETSNPKCSKGGSNSVGRVTAFQAVGRGFEPRLPLARVAQSVERVLGKDEVSGSIPLVSSSFRARYLGS